MAGFRIRSKHWLEDEDGNVVMGEGRMQIFKRIRETGSMNRTAKDLGMSYRGVWARVKATESYLNIKIVESDSRKGSQLTAQGLRLLHRYEEMKRACVRADDEIFARCFPAGGTKDLDSAE